MKQTRIALLDDHAVVRRGLANTLMAEDGFEVTGIYERGRDLIAGLAKKPADLLLLDFSLNGDEIDGVSLIRILRIKFPSSPILVFSTHHDLATVELAMRVGARGFLSKKANMAQLIGAVRTVASGEMYLTVDSDLRQKGKAPRTQEDRAKATEVQVQPVLSAREQEVIRCYLSGMTVGDIAEKFKRSIKTISAQRISAFRKLGVTTNRELFKLNRLSEP